MGLSSHLPTFSILMNIHIRVSQNALEKGKKKKSNDLLKNHLMTYCNLESFIGCNVINCLHISLKGKKESLWTKPKVSNQVLMIKRDLPTVSRFELAT